jgi:hypothetical protein
MTRPPPAPFDWPAFFRTFPLQPVPVWIFSALLLRPAGRATPWLLRATCEGAVRQAVANLAFVGYALFVPAAGASLVYLLVGRRRMARPHRLIGDWCLALVLLVSAGNDVSLIRQARARWPVLRPGLHSLRAACWK